MGVEGEREGGREGESVVEGKREESGREGAEEWAKD